MLLQHKVKQQSQKKDNDHQPDVPPYSIISEFFIAAAAEMVSYPGFAGFYFSSGTFHF